MDFYLARQPIFDRTKVVIGYDIIYRENNSSSDFEDTVYTQATAHLLLNRYLDTGIDALLGGHIAFIPLDKHLILESTTILLNEDTTVIQISSDIEPSLELIHRLRKLKSDGFLIALLDYTPEYSHKSILQLADIIEVDFNKNNRSQLKSILKEFSHTTQILLAKNIEDHETYQDAYSFGFDLFEGYYFSKPSFSKETILQQSKLNNIEILKLVNIDDPNIKIIAKRIEEDVTLTLKLLRLVNSSHYFVNKIHSVQHALAMIGIDSLKSWLNLALLDSFITNQSREIIRLSMVRMWLMEHVGIRSSQNNDINALKLIGLLSVLDVLLDKSVVDAISPLPIENMLKLTLFGEKSIYSDSYQLVLDYEKGSFKSASRHAKNITFDMNEMPTLYSNALAWSDKLYSYLYDD